MFMIKLSRLGQYLTEHTLGVIVSGIIALMAIAIINTLSHNYSLQHQVDMSNLDNQISDIANQSLRLEQMYYSTEEFQEISARELLGKAKPGEHMVILPKSAPVNQEIYDQNQNKKKIMQKSNLNQWLDFLFGNK